MSDSGATVASMVAAAWTAIALLAATLLGTLYYLGSRLDALSSRIDAQSARIDALADGLGAHMQSHPT